MEMRGGEIKIGVLADLGEFTDNHLAISRSHSGIDDQRGAIPDDDADIGNEVHTPVRDHVDVLGYLGGLVFLYERRRLALIVAKGGCMLRLSGNAGEAQHSK